MKKHSMKILALSISIAVSSASFAEETTPIEETPQWRINYLNDAEQSLRDYYTGEFPEETYQWVVDNGFKNSLLQAVGPDFRVLDNITTIRNGLTPDVAEKYKQMIFAMAVARRVDGVGSVQYKSDRFGKLSTPLTNTQLKKLARTQSFANALIPFMIENQWDSVVALENYQEVLDYLRALPEFQDENDKYFATIDDAAKYLYHYNLATGVIQEREQNATAVEYINHLASIQAQQVMPFIGKKGEYFEWPNSFPYDAPWTLLMPLAEARPVGEMNYIWERFADESVDVNHRVRKYGYYRKGKDTRAPYVASVLFPENSLQYVNYVGGLCGTMSQVGRGSYISLGMPSIAVGQPGHAALMRYNYNDLTQDYIATQEQSVAGLFNTTPDWHFFEDNSFRTAKEGREVSGEYVMGLALAMNFDLQDYLDSRTRVRIAMSIPDTEITKRKTTLRLAVSASAYNPEAWYDWHDARDGDLDRAIILINKLRNRLPTANDGLFGATAGDADQDLDQVAAEKVSLDAAIGAYRDTVIAGLLQKSFENLSVIPEGYETWIKELNYNNLYDLSRYYTYDDFYAPKIKKGKLLVDKDRLAEIKRQQAIAALKEQIAGGTLSQWSIDNKLAKIAQLEAQSELYLVSMYN